MPAPEDHLARRVSPQTLTMLMSYRRHNIATRTFMLREHANMMEDVRSQSGRFQEYAPEDVHYVEALVYIELIERLCLLIEDFAKLCHGLRGNLVDFPRRVASEGDPRRLLRGLAGPAPWYHLLRYPSPENLELPLEDRLFLSRHYERNIGVIQRLVEVLRRFLDLHWLFYVKRKHANPLIFGFRKEELQGEATHLIPYVYNTKAPDTLKVVPLRHSMYRKQQTLFNATYTLLDDLLARAVTFVERNGVGILESRAYYQMSEMEKQRMQDLVNEYDVGVQRVNLEVNMHLTLPTEGLSKFIQFYEDFDLGAFRER